MFNRLAHNVKNWLRQGQLAFGKSPEQPEPYQGPKAKPSGPGAHAHPILHNRKSPQFQPGMTDKSMANNFFDFATRYVDGVQRLMEQLSAQLKKRYDKQFQKSSAPTLTKK